VGGSVGKLHLSEHVNKHGMRRNSRSGRRINVRLDQADRRGRQGRCAEHPSARRLALTLKSPADIRRGICLPKLANLPRRYTEADLPELILGDRRTFFTIQRVNIVSGLQAEKTTGNFNQLV
jgi:hypothetical protein